MHYNLKTFYSLFRQVSFLQVIKKKETKGFFNNHPFEKIKNETFSFES